MLKAIPTELSKENILRIVSQEEIFEKVANIKTRAGIFSSPFRKDLHPSCSFRTSMNGKLYLVDWTTSEYVDCFTAVMKKYDLTFRESLQRINTVLALKLGSFYELSYTAEPTTSKNKYVEYSFVSGVWSKKDYAYWHKFGIYRETLQLFGVQKAQIVYLDNKYYWRSTYHNPIFVYTDFAKGLKLYRPLSPSKTNKWRSSCPITSVSGYKQLPEKGKLLFITSSLKDVMCLYALGYSAICLQNEQVVLDAEMYAELANRFKDIVIFFDTDEAGFRGAISYKSLYDTNSIFIPEQLGAKDPSDLVASIGQKITKKIIKYLLRELRRNKKETDVPYR